MYPIRPFAGVRPAPELASAVLAPPYDVLTTEEARSRAATRPWDFLHVSRPEIDLPADTDPYADAVYVQGRDRFLRMIREDVLRPDNEPCYYVYRLTMGTHTQTGVVATARLVAYEDGRIRPHELTRPQKEADRTRHIDILNAQTGPVALTYRQRQEIDALVESMTQGNAAIDTVVDDGVRHSLWSTCDRRCLDTLGEAFAKVERFYIADGHHRAAAAARVAAARRAANHDRKGEQPWDYLLCVLFPDKEMKIFEYNRVVKDLNGLTRDQFLIKLTRWFAVEPVGAPVQPQQAREFGMYLKGQWYRLELNEAVSAAAAQHLDVNLLGDHIIEPVLGIGDPRRDTRIEFVGGIRGLAELERRVHAEQTAVAFSLYPTSLADLMATVDAGEVMPPKSTWFEPKLADGLVCYTFD
ncbi:MAG: DUF1015 domain-containing protein [Acidiferrobacterales bacterium]